MNQEEGFIRVILEEPSDVARRLIYADWLEECGDPNSLHRAEYLRTECELDALPPKDPKRRHRTDRLRQLRALVGDDWWRQLDWTEVEHCVEFAYRCPQRWDTLTPTADASVRHCPECRQNVYYCRTPLEAYRRARKGQCVAIDSRQARVPLSAALAAQRAGRLLGRVAPTVPRRIPLPLRGTMGSDGEASASDSG